MDYRALLAHRMTDLGTETAFSVLARARALEAQGRDVIHLEIGEPDFATPSHIRRAAAEAMENGHTHYTPAPGLPEARAAIARYVSRTRRVPVDPEQVVITPGGKPIMFFAILALVNPGDEVILPDPGFPIYESMVRFVGGVPVRLHLREENGFQVDPDDFARLLDPATKLVVLNSPHNPTGGTMDHETLGRIAAACAERELMVLSDEIYGRICYGVEHAPTLLGFPGMAERTIVLDGFSKTYAMTGWRLGYGVMPQPLAEQVGKLMVNSNSCTAAFSQIAGIAALEGPQDDVEAMVAEFKRRRDVVVAGLNEIPGISCRLPTGAFYAFPNVSRIGLPSARIAAELLERAGVAVLPGTAFGEGGEGYLRLSFANSLHNLERALRRMADVMSTLR